MVHEVWYDRVIFNAAFEPSFLRDIKEHILPLLVQKVALARIWHVATHFICSSAIHATLILNRRYSTTTRPSSAPRGYHVLYLCDKENVNDWVVEWKLNLPVPPDEVPSCDADKIVTPPCCPTLVTWPLYRPPWLPTVRLMACEPKSLLC